MENSSENTQALLGIERQIDDCCDRFEAAWKSGRPPQIDAYLDEFPEAVRPKLLRELLAIEVNYWSAAERRRLSKDIFLIQHPHLAPLIDDEVEGQFATRTEGRTIRASGDSPGGANAVAGRRGSTRRDSRGLHIRCPHCQNPVELLADSPLEEISCGACGDSFSLVEREGESFTRTPLKRIGRFELTSRLGVGGFGTVWKALDTELDRVVALKIPRKGQLSSSETEQFFREARAAAQLKHPNIVPVHEVGRDGDTIFIVTDLIHGVSLADWLKEEKPSAKEAAKLIAVIADALHFAHQQGVVHRDLKPSNIMIDTAGQPHLMDFGLAKREIGEVTMTVEGQILGTPAYMSPEQAQGQTSWIDRRTDIYSLGVVLFELLTRELPYRGGVQQQIHQRIRDDAPSPRKLNSHIPIDLATICLKCLERDPNRRYSTAAEMSAELNRFLRGEPIVARPISPLARLARWAKRNPAVAAAGALTVLLAIGGPLAAIMIESSRRTAVTQREKIASQLNERNALISEYEQRIDAESAKLKSVSEQQEALIDASPGIEQIVPEWRKRLIVEYLQQHESAILESLENSDLSGESRAQAEIGLGYLLAEVDRREEAIARFDSASLLLAKLSREHSDADQFRLALADCYMQMSDLQRALDRKQEAKQSALRAVAIREELARRQPASSARQLEYLDAVMGAEGATADRESRVPHDAAQGKSSFQEMHQVRGELKNHWSSAPSALYELGCYLTLRSPLLVDELTSDKSP
jgi:serine/threonine protein kinase